MSELSVIQSTEEAQRLISELKKTRKMLKDLKALEEKLIRKLVSEMKDHEVLVSEDGEELITYKFTADVNFFDSKRLLLDNPELYEAYLDKRPGSRRFVVK
jgi:hypothetical protein